MYMQNSNVSVLFEAENIKKVYEESLRMKSLDIVCLATNYEGVIGDYFEKSFAPTLYGRIHTREIVRDSDANRKDAMTKDKSINAVKFLNGESETDMILSRDRAVLISFSQDSPLAIVITDSELVKGLSTQFNALWKSL